MSGVTGAPDRPFTVAPASAAGLRLLIVNPGYFLWPLALWFLVAAAGPVIVSALDPAPPAPIEQSAPQVEEPPEHAGEGGPERGWGVCLGGRAVAPAEAGIAAGAGPAPESLATAAAAAALAAAAVVAAVMIQGAVYRLLLGRVPDGVSLRLGGDEVRLLIVTGMVLATAALAALPFVALGLGVLALPAPCGALTGGAALFWLLGGLAAVACLARLACLGPAVVDHRRFALREGLDAGRDVADLVALGGVAGMGATLLLTLPLQVVAAVASGQLGGGNGEQGGAAAQTAEGPAALLAQSAAAAVIFFVVVTLSSLSGYAYVRVTRGRHPDALAISPTSEPGGGDL